MTDAPPIFHALRVAAVDRDTDDSVVVTFAQPDPPLAFRHGQHLTLRRFVDGVDVRRGYSLCTRAPDGPLRVAIRLVPGGVCSTWAVDELAAGDVVDVMAPTGHFTHELDPGAPRRYALFAAGSGITPILSIAATVLAGEPHSSVELLCVNRTSRSTMLLEDLEDLRDRHLGRLRISYLFTREPTAAALLSGRPDRARLDALVAAGFLPADADHAFLCGPHDLTTDVRDALVAAGMPAERVHRELFNADQLGAARRPPARAVDASAPVVARAEATLHGRTTALELYEGDTVLEAMERVRPDVPYSCRSGVCTTCQARLVSGTVTMAVDHGLDDTDRARGLVLTCQAVPTGAHVVVDYDV
jgi:ring-1,2-phenylacetyl-CoA epoxidase subunit PaaE